MEEFGSITGYLYHLSKVHLEANLVPKIFKKFEGKGKYVEKNMFAVVRYSLFQILVVLDTTFD